MRALIILLSWEDDKLRWIDQTKKESIHNQIFFYKYPCCKDNNLTFCHLLFIFFLSFGSRFAILLLFLDDWRSMFNLSKKQSLHLSLSIMDYIPFLYMSVTCHQIPHSFHSAVFVLLMCCIHAQLWVVLNPFFSSSRSSNKWVMKNQSTTSHQQETAIIFLFILVFYSTSSSSPML